ncbi:hypothetical protein HELRODRAFT_159864 [Helobdella robusta]|uniref:Uncharacterized protein n=1 Tax=Helobdella robusta TaxID=6412 RepID=T1EPH2_HELRO|nr:hypothetical protein HELRODRAFT_159864 [Helobdella robusta]ESO13228.1 hypothetical protein HELRODRAFT_159864 [Helobdella robusta]
MSSTEEVNSSLDCEQKQTCLQAVVHQEYSISKVYHEMKENKKSISFRKRPFLKCRRKLKFHTDKEHDCNIQGCHPTNEISTSEYKQEENYSFSRYRSAGRANCIEMRNMYIRYLKEVDNEVNVIWERAKKLHEKRMLEQETGSGKRSTEDEEEDGANEEMIPSAKKIKSDDG